jgi:PAS domain S-box-containing protein
MTWTGAMTLEHTQNLFARVGQHGELRAVNAAWTNTFGALSQASQPFISIIHPEDKAISLDYLMRLNHAHDSVVFANRCRDKSGDYHHILWQATATDDAHIVVGINTTPYAQEEHVAAFLAAEHSLMDSNALLSTLFKVVPPGIAIVDRNANFMRLNPSFCDMFGYSEADLLGKSISTVIIDSDLSLAAFQNHDLPVEAICGEFDGERQDGTYLHVELLSSRLTQHGKPLTVTMMMDVSARKQALQNLADNEERLRLAIENLPIMVDAIDQNGHIVLWNKMCEKVTGYTKEDMLNNPDALALLYPDAPYRQHVLSSVQAVIEEKPDYRRGEWALTCKDGSRKSIAWSVNGQMNLPGYAVWSIGEDVTERNQAFKELRENQESLRLMIENLPIMVDGMDEEGNIILWNLECERVTGYSAEEVIGNPEALSWLYPDPGYRAQMRIAVRNTLASEPCIRHGEWQMTCKDGSEKTIAWSVNTHLRIPDLALLAIGADVTERKKAQAQLEANEQRLRMLVENMPVMLAAYDESGNLVMWNKHCEEVTGHPAKKMLHNPDAIYALYPQPEALREWKLWLNSTSFAEWESEVLCQNGLYKTIKWSNMSGPLPIPGWKHWVIGEDVTVFKKRHQALDENNALLGAALEHVSTAVAITDSRQYFVYVNHTYCDLYGYEADDLLDNPLSKVMAIGSQSFVFRHYFSFYTGAHGEIHQERCTGIHHEGHKISTNLTARRFQQDSAGKVLTYVVWMHEMEAP